MNTAHGSVQSAFREHRIVRNSLVPVNPPIFPLRILQILSLGSVAFIIGFIDDKKTIFIAQLIEIGNIGIMAASNGIKVVFFNQTKVGFHLFQSYNRACDRIRVMPVYAAELDGCSIDHNPLIFHMDLSEADSVGDDFRLCLKEQIVEIWLLRIP